MAKQPTLAVEIQTFIVQQLACFDTPSVVASSVKAEFGHSITRQHVETYDPTKRCAKRLAKRWRELFAATRKEFLEDNSKIGISHRAVRLRALERMAQKAEAMGNMALAAQLYEQAAKEVGESYTNRREFTGKNGAPLPAAAAVTVFALPDNGRG